MSWSPGSCSKPLAASMTSQGFVAKPGFRLDKKVGATQE